jgi:hypothetical protein
MHDELMMANGRRPVYIFAVAGAAGGQAGA